jgi:hypothetical protein
MAEKSQETISKYLGDMHALLDHGQQPLSRQVDQIRGLGHPEALSLVEDIDQALRRQRDEVDARLKALGGSPTGPVKEAVSAVAGVAAGVYNDLRTEQASKSLRDDYAFLGLAGVSYLMLHTTALGLGDAPTADLAARGYRACARLQEEVDRVMPGLVLAELRQDGLMVADVAAECHQLVHDAWQSGRGDAQQMRAP